MIIVYVTIPKDKADVMAKLLLERKVCACVNIISSVSSYYWWQGKIDCADESLLIIKTQDELYFKLEQAVKENHPYEVPEIAAFKIDQGNFEYLNWLKKSCE